MIKGQLAVGLAIMYVPWMAAFTEMIERRLLGGDVVAVPVVGEGAGAVPVVDDGRAVGEDLADQG